MKYFAKLDVDNNVLEVLMVSDEDITDPEGNEAEVLGKTLLFNLTRHRFWKQVTEERKNFAGIGFKYYENLDAFIAPKPFPSFVLNEQTCRFEAPVSCPDDGKIYRWNEELTNWIEMV